MRLNGRMDKESVEYIHIRVLLSSQKTMTEDSLSIIARNWQRKGQRIRGILESGGVYKWILRKVRGGM